MGKGRLDGWGPNDGCYINDGYQDIYIPTDVRNACAEREREDARYGEEEF